jgi:transposase InsO family protein
VQLVSSVHERLLRVGSPSTDSGHWPEPHPFTSPSRQSGVSDATTTGSGHEQAFRTIPLGQYTAIRFTQRLADAGIQPSMGSVGDSFDTQSMMLAASVGVSV